MTSTTRRRGSLRFDPLAYLASNAAEHGDALAVYDPEQSLTFTQLYRVVQAYMAALRAHGVRSTDVVAVSLPNIWQYVAIEIAVPAIGATLMPLPPSLGAREISTSIARAGARLVVAETHDAPAAVHARSGTKMPDVVTVDELAIDNAHASLERGAGPVDPDRIVQIALTSGTTGPPKLAALSARLKQLTFEGFTTRLGFGPKDRVMPMSPVTQGVGEMCLYALRTGAALVMTRDRRFEPNSVLTTMQRSGATVLAGVPTMLSRLRDAVAGRQVDFTSLRATICAGAPLPPALAREWEGLSGSATCNSYGAMDIGQLAVARTTDPVEKRWTTVGQPHDAADWQVCDSAGRPVPIGVEGEICMRGPLVQSRYWDDGTTPYAADGWAHFGDLGYVDEDGFLHVTGRIKDTIIRGGNNVNPLEVENLLREHPRIQDVAVVGIPDTDLGERAVAFVVREGGPPLSLAEVTRFLDERGLARYKWPEFLHNIEILPTAATGKLDRSRLRTLAAEARSERQGN